MTRSKIMSNEVANELKYSKLPVPMLYRYSSNNISEFEVMDCYPCARSKIFDAIVLQIMPLA